MQKLINITLFFTVVAIAVHLYTVFTTPLTPRQRANVYKTEMSKCGTQHCINYYVDLLEHMGEPYSILEDYEL